MILRENASYSIKELKFNRVYPTTEIEWEIINRYLLEKVS